MTDTDTGRTVTVLGREYPVQLTDGAGLNRVRFRVDLGNGQELDGSSWWDLEKKAGEYKDVRFDMPFTTRHGTDGSVTGFHAGNGSMLVRWADGRTGQYRDSELRGAMPRLSATESARLAELSENVRAASAALDAFITAREFRNGARQAAQAAREKEAGLA